MNLTINGDSLEIDEKATVADVLARFGLAPQRVAVEVNETLVRRAMFPERVLCEGDRVEIVTFVGGG